MVVALLFIMKRSTPDLYIAVGFLTTRVSKSDIDDWVKLKRVLRFFIVPSAYDRDFLACIMKKDCLGFFF